MGRTQRAYEVMMTQTAVNMGTDDNADLVLNGIMVPDNNVPLREAGTIQTTAGGATAATYTMVFEERNSTTALTTTSGNLDPDAAQFSVASVYGPATPIGSGAYAQTKGSLISLNLQYSAATGASAAVSTVYAIWQM